MAKDTPSKSGFELRKSAFEESFILVGSCNHWAKDSKDLAAARKDFLFTLVNSSAPNTQEYKLEVNIDTKSHLSFQIVGAESLWDLRVHPVGNDKEAKELRCGQKVRGCLTQNRQETVHGLNFRIRESPPATIEVRVAFSEASGIAVWYEHKGRLNAVYVPRLEDVAPWQSHDEVGSLRLIGRFCKRRIDVQGLLLEPQKPREGVREKWRRHQLCIRMQHRELKFQVISDKLGFEWRLCPSRGGKRSIVPVGEGNGMAAVVGRKQDGYGRKHFRIQQNFLTVVLLTVWMEVLEDEAVGRVSVTYTVEEERPPQVALGLRDMQFPPQEVSRMDRMIAKIAHNPRVLEVIKERLRAVVNVMQREHNTTILTLSDAAPGASTQKVAAMLMVLPRALAGWPGVFRTYLHYHLLAPDGPKFAHIFVFIDEPNEEDDDGLNEEADDEDDAGSLARWLDESEEALDLRPLVTLLDGSGPACLQAALGRREAELDAKLRAAALGGELVARQILNMQRCLEMAYERGLDWLFCNLDADEAFVCRGAVGDLFAAVPPEKWQLQVINHEAVMESREPEADFFRHCTLFKRSPLLLMESKGRSEEQKRCMDFWGLRAASAAAEARAVMGDVTAPVLRPSDGYFAAYFIGKSAVRVRECYDSGLAPVGPHDWPILSIGNSRADSEDACILHYVNCQGTSGLVQKYSVRTAERWNKIEFHTLCQKAYAHSSTLLESLIREALVLRRDDAAELEAQLAAGVCMRITKVRDACRGSAC